MMNQNVLDHAFFQARLKINRADSHRQEAEAWFRRYIESDFCKLIEELDPETLSQSFHVKAEPIPAGLILAIGDTFHCLSCAIDYVMTGMARAVGVSTNRVGFPTDETRQALRKSFMPPKKAGAIDPPKRRIMKIFPAFVMLLLQKIRPYRGGDFLLWEIRKADNIDKHNLIIPAVTITELTGISLFDEENQNSITNATCQVNPGGSLSLLSYSMGGGRMKITDKGKPTARITFPDSSEVFAGDPVFPTLLQCVQRVAEVVTLIEAVGTKSSTRR